MPKAEPPRLPLYVHRKRAKGRTYFYFDTGAKNKRGAAVLKRLPDLASRDFGPAYSAALAMRGKRKTIEPVLTLGAMMDLWQRSDQFRGKAKKTQAVYELYSRIVVENFGMAPAAELERQDVVRLMDSMAEKPGAANMVRAIIASLYKWARARGHVGDVHPTRDVDPFNGEEHAPWPQELVDAALADDDPVIRTSVALLYFTAQRIGDVCAMRWSDIRGDRITVTQQKTGKTLAIQLHSDLAALLPKPAGMTILSVAGRPISVQALRKRLKAWAAARGFDIVPHGLRKNAVNTLLEAECSIAETAAISGQSLSMVEHYAKQRNQTTLASAAILKWEGKRKANVKTN